MRRQRRRGCKRAAAESPVVVVVVRFSVFGGNGAMIRLPSFLSPGNWEERTKKTS